MPSTPAGFGRPGRRAEIARDLHEAFSRHGVDLLPGRARQMVDDRVAEVAEAMRVSEQTALRHLPPGWAEDMASDVAVQRAGEKVAEDLATGTASISASRLGTLLAGLAVCIQDGVWRVAGGLPVAIGEPLDCLTGLALSLQSMPSEVEVSCADLLAAARHLGNESDVLRAGMDSPDRDDPQRIAQVVARLADDAAWARRIAAV